MGGGQGVGQVYGGIRISCGALLEYFVMMEDCTRGYIGTYTYNEF